MNKFVLTRWLKTIADSVGAWWGIMSGAVSIPFAFLALFNLPGRLLFAALAYISLWVLIVAQAKRILELQKRSRPYFFIVANASSTTFA
jgi:uncharacterized membrane protein HdeD (DUF308 family)